MDLDIPRGEIFGLIGHNGAGKSTLFKMMLGLVPATQGSLVVGGAQVGGRDFRAARRHLGYLPENVVLYDNLSGLETLRFSRASNTRPRRNARPCWNAWACCMQGSGPCVNTPGHAPAPGFCPGPAGPAARAVPGRATNGLDPQAIRDFYATLRGLRPMGSRSSSPHILAELQERVDRPPSWPRAGSGRGQCAGAARTDQMPLCFTIDLAPQDATEACRLLAQATGSRPVLPTGLRLRCPRTHKMAVLAALAPLGARVQDLKMLEPSLEDVFFGFAQTERRPMELTQIFTIAAKEFRDRMRNRWVLAVALVFTVFSLVIACGLGGAQQGCGLSLHRNSPSPAWSAWSST